MKNNKKQAGFTLAELLIVVAIIAVLVAISIPIFTSQLEKSREATDLANARSAYAEVMAAANAEDQTAVSSLTGDLIYKDGAYSVSVPLKQKKKGWQTKGDLQVGSCSRNGGYPYWIGDPGNMCTVKYEKEVTSVAWAGDPIAALITTKDQSGSKLVKTEKGVTVFADTWSSALATTNHAEDIKRANDVQSALKKLGFEAEDVTFESNWGTIYDDTWTYGISQTEKTKDQPKGTKYLIATVNGAVTSEDAGKRVNAVAIDINGKVISGTVEVSTNEFSCWSGRTSVALINFEPNGQ